MHYRLKSGIAVTETGEKESLIVPIVSPDQLQIDDLYFTNRVGAGILRLFREAGSSTALSLSDCVEAIKEEFAVDGVDSLHDDVADYLNSLVEAGLLVAVEAEAE